MPPLYYDLAYPLWLTGALPGLLAAKRLQGRWSDRVGRPDPATIPPEGKPVIWIHAASFGEARIGSALGTRLAKNHDMQCFATAMTMSGLNVFDRDFSQKAAFLPLDFVFTQQELCSRVRPRLLVIMEKDLWPNLIWSARASGAKIAVANSLFSKRVLQSTGIRARLLRHSLAMCDLVCTQNEFTAGALRKMAPASCNIETCGNMKFDMRGPLPDKELVQRLKAELASKDTRPVFIAGSTHAGEEEMLLDAFSGLRDRFRMFLAPRYTHRAADVAALARRAGYSTALRSDENDSHAQVVIIDTMGELSALYALARVAFIGGSLVRHGGQNPIEAAAHGVVILHGPHMDNFQDLSDSLEGRGAMTVSGTADLAGVLTDLMTSPEKAKALGEHGRKYIQDNSGAFKRHMEAFDRLLGERTS